MNPSKLKEQLRGDWQIWCILILLSLASIAVVYSATSALAFRKTGGNTEYYLLSHSFHVFLGFAVTFIIHRISYVKYAGISKILLWITPFLLIYTLTFGKEVGDAKRWVSVLGVSFQTSDLVRLVLIANLAAMLAKRQNIDYQARNIWGLIIWCGGICLLLAFSSFSTAVILGATCFMIMWIGRVPARYLVRMAGIVILALVLAIFGCILLAKFDINFGRGQTVVDRVEAFVDKDIDGNGIIGGVAGASSNQKDYALVAIARGGVFGVGPGKSSQRNILPDAFSDFIYAIIIEEYGFLGGVIIMVLYLWLLYRGLKNIEFTERAFGGLLSVGLTLSIVFQAFSHMFINVGLGPVSGQTLPLISMGVIILFTSVAIGVVLSVSRGEESEARILRK